MNVRCFGAKGDGVHEDLAAIQMAINALPSTGGTVYFPPGKYVIKETSNVPEMTRYSIELYNRAKIKLLGAGRDVTTLFDPDLHPISEPDGPLIAMGIVYGYQSIQLEFQHLGFEGVAIDVAEVTEDPDTSFEWGHGGVNMRGCSDVLIHDCKFRNLWAGAVYADFGSTRIRTNSSVFHECWGPFINYASGQDHEAHGNYLSNCAGSPILCTGSRMSITHNRIEQTVERGTSAVVIGQGTNILIGWNTICDTKFSLGILGLFEGAASTFREVTIVGNVISGNKFIQDNDEAAVGAILIDGTVATLEDILIEGNHISENGKDTGTCAVPGILIVGDQCTGNILVQNNVISKGTSGNTTIGIWIGSTVPKNNKIHIGTNVLDVDHPICAQTQPGAGYSGPGYAGLSTTGIPVRNPFGVVTISDLATSATVSFPGGLPEDDALYQIHTSAGTVDGPPAALSLLSSPGRTSRRPGSTSTCTRRLG
ncbi:right-handed parallel beta-helix repeat-containing protein [Polyangium fumosum]|uniref:right-handed parallel beta-helix repeat-containing protein n=1 Tax=Polyangium fumosum TaxID=889272 RepID=UPI001B86D47C|nr:right-handed parallel beta-helix repeat-containing protein [Polyangium fumosum]